MKEKKNENEPGLNSLLKWVSVFLSARLVLDFIFTFQYEASSSVWVGRVFYVLEFILTAGSFWCFTGLKKPKKAVLLFLAFGVVEFAQQVVLFVLAQSQGVMTLEVQQQFFAYAVGTVAYMVPLILYYRKRWSLLNEG